MRLKQEINLQDFLHAVNECGGEVILRFSQDNELNIKSMLSKVVLATLYETRELFDDAEVLCENKADEKILEKFTDV